MAELTWDGVGEKVFETGVDHGVLYIPNEDGEYDNGVAWNGLTNVTETPSGAEQTKTYADNIVYGVLTSVEEFGATVTCYTYPPEFEVFDGLAEPVAGVKVGQQPRRAFGFAFRTRKGNDVVGDAFGYKLHLLYGCFASPSERSYATVNDSPEMTEFSYELTSVPVPVTIDGDQSQTSILTIDSTEVGAAQLAALEEILFGTGASDPALPTPDEVLNILGGVATATDVVVAGDVDSIDITGTTAGVLFSVEHWDGDEWVDVVDGQDLTEAEAEALVLANGLKRVTLSAADGSYIPAAQQNVFIVTVT